MPTHKRRQKSFGADSPEVVTTGMLASLMERNSQLRTAPLDFQIKSDRIGKLNSRPSALQSRDGPIGGLL